MDIMNSFELLGPVATDLHFKFRNLYYVMLPVFFSLSLLFAWFRNPLGGPDFLETLKRAVVATLLLVGYVEICDTLLAITNGISDVISDMSGMNSLFAMAGEKIRDYPMKLSSAIFATQDLLLSIVAFASWAILYFARLLMVAVYHFSWTFLTIIAPIVLLFHLFSPKITLNFFKCLVEVACWQIVWSVLSAMLRALPFGEAYHVEGSFITVMFLNFVIAICMFLTPFVVRAIIGSGFSAAAASLSPLAAKTMMSLPAKAGAAMIVGRSVLSGASSMMASTPYQHPAKGTDRGQFIAETDFPKEPGGPPSKPPQSSTKREPASSAGNMDSMRAKEPGNPTPNPASFVTKDEPGPKPPRNWRY